MPANCVYRCDVAGVAVRLPEILRECEPLVIRNARTMNGQFKVTRAAPVVWVRDILGMIEFYKAKLDFTDVWKQGDPNSPAYAIVMIDEVEVHFSPSKPERAGQGSFHLLVADVNAYWEFVRAQGVQVVNEMADRDYAMRDFVIRDFEGNLIEIGQNT